MGFLFYVLYMCLYLFEHVILLFYNIQNRIVCFFFAVKQVVSVRINDQLLQILKKISRSLRQREREKLEKLYSWAPNEDLKQVMDRDSSFFLAGILHKEIREKQTIIDPGMDKH